MDVPSISSNLPLLKHHPECMSRPLHLRRGYSPSYLTEWFRSTMCERSPAQTTQQTRTGLIALAMGSKPGLRTVEVRFYRVANLAVFKLQTNSKLSSVCLRLPASPVAVFSGGLQCVCLSRL